MSGPLSSSDFRTTLAQQVAIGVAGTAANLGFQYGAPAATAMVQAIVGNVRTATMAALDLRSEPLHKRARISRPRQLMDREITGKGGPRPDVPTAPMVTSTSLGGGAGLLWPPRIARRVF